MASGHTRCFGISTDKHLKHYQFLKALLEWMASGHTRCFGISTDKNLKHYQFLKALLEWMASGHTRCFGISTDKNLKHWKGASRFGWCRVGLHLWKYQTKIKTNWKYLLSQSRICSCSLKNNHKTNYLSEKSPRKWSCIIRNYAIFSLKKIDSFLNSI